MCHKYGDKTENINILCIKDHNGSNIKKKKFRKLLHKSRKIGNPHP